MKKITYATFILCLSAPTFTDAALAQQPQYTGGMKYTTMRPNQDSAQNKDTQEKAIYNRNPAPTQTAEPAKDALPKIDGIDKIDEAAVKPAEQTVWDKYRELAAGKESKDSNEGNNNAKPEKPRKPQAPQKQAKAEQPAPTGIGAIIQDYRKTKEKRGQMKSIRFKQPASIDKPQIDKPQIQKPSQ